MLHSFAARRLLCALTIVTLGAISAWLTPLPAVAQQSSDPAGSAAAESAIANDQPAEFNEEYYELLKLFVDTLDQIDRNYVTDVSRRELMEAAIEGMLSKLDQYSNYLPEDELDQLKRGVESEFGGIGIHVSLDDEDHRLTIISPLVGSPAYRVGLVAGDKIMEIDGKSTEGMTVHDAVEQMKGRIGTSVQLTVLRAGSSKTETLTVPREIVRVETVMGFQRDEDDAWTYFIDPQNKIGYVRLTAFSRHTAEELRKALESLKSQGMRALVLDLRFNPGGLLSAAIEVSDLFVSEGRIVSMEGRNAPEQVWDAHREGTFDGFPVALVVNRFSASASEIVAACLKDNDVAVVVGERTWGKGSVQNIIELEGGRSGLKLTTAGYLRPNGKNIHRFDGASPSDDWGVQPDEGLAVELSMAQTRNLHNHLRQLDLFGRPDEPEEGEDFVDRQLNKAVDYLKAKLDDADPPAEDAAEVPVAQAGADQPAAADQSATVEQPAEVSAPQP